MIPPNQVIQGLWIGPQLSALERLSIQSFLHHGHQYHLYVYDRPTNVPDGTMLRDAGEILSRDRVFTYQSGFGKGSFAGFADLFRYHLLFTRGGWWADTDVVCLRPWDHTSETVICSSFEGEWGALANNCVLKFPAGSPLAAFLAAEADKADPSVIGFGETGPQLVQRLVRKFACERLVVPPEQFCPIVWRAVHRIAYPQRRPSLREAARAIRDRARWLLRPNSRPGRVTASSYAIHLWHEVWRNSGLDKNARYSPACLFERLKQRHGIEASCAR